MTDNPYMPSQSSPAAKARPVRRLRRFAILNAVLVALPVLLLLSLSVLLRASGVQISGVSGRIGWELPLFGLLYFALPNGILLMLLARRHS